MICNLSIACCAGSKDIQAAGTYFSFISSKHINAQRELAKVFSEHVLSYYPVITIHHYRVIHIFDIVPGNLQLDARIRYICSVLKRYAVFSPAGSGRLSCTFDIFRKLSYFNSIGHRVLLIKRGSRVSCSPSDPACDPCPSGKLHYSRIPCCLPGW